MHIELRAARIAAAGDAVPTVRWVHTAEPDPAGRRQDVDPTDGADADGDGTITLTERAGWLRRLWRRSPRSFRIVVVSATGSTLVVTGLLLVVLPGPFTLPLVLAGLAVLATEFAWAARALERGRSAASGLLGFLRRR